MELLDDSRLTTMRLLTEAYTSLNSLCAEHFAAHGLAAIEFEVLLRLARAPGRQLRMTDLSRHTAMSTSGVTRMVDRLEREGLVARVPCDTDRRSSFAVLTAQGLTRLAETVPGHLEILDEWLIGPLTQRQLQGLVAGLRVVRDAVRPDAAPAIEMRAPRRPSTAPARR